MGRYAAWNLFGAGVAALAGKIGRSRCLFLERAEPISVLADRSVLVASYFFDAARDEFDDRDTAHRDTHRCLAQALLKGIIAYGRRERTEWNDPAFVNALLAEPVWLQALTARVGHGYGAMSPDELPAIFRCMGYHLGSEVLADQEFSTIDLLLAHQFATWSPISATPRSKSPGACTRPTGGSASTRGTAAPSRPSTSPGPRAGRAWPLIYGARNLHDPLHQQLLLGFVDFTRDHREFFENVNSP